MMQVKFQVFVLFFFFPRLWVSPWILFRKIELLYKAGVSLKELGDQEP